MKISKETKIGLLAIVATAVTIWGYRFIRGRNILSRSNLYYVEYQQIDQLGMSSPVLINGFQVGVVADRYLNPETMKSIVVVLDISKDVPVPKNAVAELVPAGFMGGHAINLLFDEPCSGGDCAGNGDYLQGASKGLLSKMLAVDTLDAYISVVKEGLLAVADTLGAIASGKRGDNEISRSVKDVREILIGLKGTTNSLNRLVASSNPKVQGILGDASSVSGNLRANNEEISRILANFDTLSGTLAQADLEKIVNELTLTLQQLKGTLNKADAAVAGLGGVITKLEQGEGTLGRLMSSDSLYNQLNVLSQSLDTLLVDFRLHPYRYMPLKSKRKVEKYDKQLEEQ